MGEELREVRNEDLHNLLHLLHQLSGPSEEDKNVDQAKLEAAMKKMVEDENHCLYVLEQDGKLLGTGMLLVQLNLSHGGKPYGHIENIVVDSECRKQGIGKSIVMHLIEKARERNCYKVILNCKMENMPFYVRCGMRKGEIEMRLDL